MTDQDAFFAMPIDPLSDASARIVYAAEAITGLLPYLDRARDFPLPDLVRNACLEAWFINLRLVAEFLLGTKHDKSMEADDFIAGWRIADPKVRDAVGRELGLASEYVARIGRRTTVGKPVDVSGAALERRAVLILDALEIFMNDLDDVDTQQASAFKMALQFGRLNLKRFGAAPAE